MRNKIPSLHVKLPFVHVHTYVGVKRKRCGSCPGCTRSDCGRYKYCIDKPKFGGLGKKKQCCEPKKCQSLTTPERISTSTGIHSEVHNEASASIATVDKFLLNHDRKIHNIKGDGNYLFRSFSHAFLDHFLTPFLTMKTTISH